MSASTLLPFQPASMSTAQLAAVSYLARDSGHTHHLYAYQLRRWFGWCQTNGLDPLVGIQRAHIELYVRTNLRAGPGLEYPVIGQVEQATEAKATHFVLTTQQTTNLDGYVPRRWRGWFEVSFGDTRAWVSSRRLTHQYVDPAAYGDPCGVWGNVDE